MLAPGAGAASVDFRIDKLSVILAPMDHDAELDRLRHERRQQKEQAAAASRAAYEKGVTEEHAAWQLAQETIRWAYQRCAAAGLQPRALGLKRQRRRWLRDGFVEWFEETVPVFPMLSWTAESHSAMSDSSNYYEMRAYATDDGGLFTVEYHEPPATLIPHFCRVDEYDFRHCSLSHYLVVQGGVRRERKSFLFSADPKPLQQPRQLPDSIIAFLARLLEGELKP